MNTYRNRPKGNYIQNASWSDLYILTENWKCDLDFYLLDIEFLERLIETYFVKLLLNENLDELRELQNDLSHSQNQCKSILHRIQIHLTYIINLIDAPYKYDVSAFRNKHEQFEDEISEFKDMVKVMRRMVFKMTKSVLESEKPKFIWKLN